MVQASFYELLRTQRDYALEFDNFFSSALEYRPYTQVRGLVSKGFGEHFTLDAGADGRWLRDGDDEGAYNHEFERYFVTPTLQRVPWKGLSLSVTGEFWNSDEDVWSWGADATHKCTEALKVSLGTFYSLYKYDYYAASERDDVRTIYARVRWKLENNLRLDGGYEYEHSDFDTIQTVRLGVTWDF